MPEQAADIPEVPLEDKLGKIRTQLSSKLDNQKRLALVLNAVEENLDEQHNDRTPVAYFVLFLLLLDQSVTDDTIVDSGLATATAYFLDLVFPYTPGALLRSRFGDILAKLASALTHPEAEAPLVRSTIGALETLLVAQDHQQWTVSGSISPKRALVGLLEMSFDARPKVRRRAQEAVHEVLTNPPASPQPHHVAAGLCGELALKRVLQLAKEAVQNKKKKDASSGASVIHGLQLVAAITLANAWPAAQIEPLCDVLLELLKTSDQYVVLAAFAAFTGLFASMSNVIDTERFARVLDIIFDLRPQINDTHLAASWLAVVAKALENYAQLAPEECVKRLSTALPVVSDFLAADAADIYTLAAQCLIAIVTQAIPDRFLLQAGAQLGVSQELYEQMDETVEFVASHAEELLSIKYQLATREILEYIAAALSKLRSRANPDFLAVVESVGQWRTNETDSFAHNKEAEDVVAAAISALGPDAVLGVLPLNLAGQGAGRAWLLPLLRDNVRMASLGFYRRDVLPVVDFFQEQIAQATNKESINTKIFHTIVDQVWDLLPHFCDLPTDLQEAFDGDFAARLSDLMYSNVELRVPICHALRLLVESNVAYAEGALADDLLVQEQLSVEQARANLAYLGTLAPNMLLVLFNVFSSTAPESRGFILETIDTYLQVVLKTDLEATFDKVCGLLKDAMEDPEKAVLAACMMDLVVAMAKYVPEASHNALFAIFASTVSMEGNAQMQKRSYRIIAALGDSETGRQSVSAFFSNITEVLVRTTETTHTSARASRLTGLNIVVDLLPSSELHFVPSILQEVIMSTKDVNERSRELSYQILIKMGRKMAAGGVVAHSRVPGFGEDAPNSEASLTEYFTMVSAGLAAQLPHMILAAITAISCLIFEFKDELPVEVLLEIASTVELFLTHNSREIAKSAIGFVKVEVLSLPEDLVRQNLPELLTKLMRWSHEHKGHFKSKVKHILERLIRKFGVELVEQAIPEDDRKLVANIKKSRNRAKRKEGEAEAGSSVANPEKKFTSAYEEALYDSDVSDDEASADEEDRSSSKKKTNQFIMEGGDEPLDLLDRQTLAHISSSKPKKFGKKDMAAKSDVKMRNGKLVFSADNNDPLEGKVSGIDAYLDAIKQAPVRGQRNKLKFKKNTKDTEDWSEDEDEATAKKPQSKGKFSKARISKPKKQKFKATKKL